MSEIPLAVIVCAGCALAAGAFFVVAGLLCTTRLLLFLRRAERAEGVVVEARLTRPAGCGDTCDVWTLTVEYEDATGVKRQGLIDVARARPLSLRPGQVVARPVLVIGSREYEVGDRVPVRYDPRCPSFVVIGSVTETWAGLLVVDAVAVVFVALLVWLACSAAPGWLGGSR